jgi:O-antigen ligase
MAAVRRTALVLVPLSLVLAKYFPSLGRAQEKHWAADSWIGVATHKNTLGQLCFVAVVVLGLHVLITAKRRRLSLMAIPFAMPTEVICLSASVYLLFGMGGSTYSSTSVLATLTALAMLRVASAFRHTPRLLPGFLVASLFGLLLLAAASEVLVGESLQSTVAALQGKDATLAGRTDLWQEVWRRASQHPLFGSGYGGFWTPEVVAEFAAMPRFSWDPQQSHNGYLETFAQLGSIGVVLLLWVIWHGLSGLARTMAADFRHGQLALSLLVAVLALNYAEAAFPRQNHLIWFVCLVVCSLPANSGGRVQGGGPSAPSREPKPGRKDERPAAKRAQVDPARDRRDVRSVDLGPWGF